MESKAEAIGGESKSEMADRETPVSRKDCTESREGDVKKEKPVEVSAAGEAGWSFRAKSAEPFRG
jgi:hypothetical protein